MCSFAVLLSCISFLAGLALLSGACLEDVIYTCTVDQRLGKCIPHICAMNQIKMATTLQEEEELLCLLDNKRETEL